MPTLEEIKSQIATIGQVGTFGTKKEIKYLPEILESDESVLYLTSGMMDGSTWLVVCTPKRVIFLDKGMLYGLQQRETPLEKINAIEQKTGLIFGEIGIVDGASRMVIKNCAKKTVKPFVAAVNKARQAVMGGTMSESGPSDPLVRLERLGALMQQGLLSMEEFEVQKAKILDEGK